MCAAKDQLAAVGLVYRALMGGAWGCRSKEISDKLAAAEARRRAVRLVPSLHLACHHGEALQLSACAASSPAKSLSHDDQSPQLPSEQLLVTAGDAWRVSTPLHWSWWSLGGCAVQKQEQARRDSSQSS